MSNLNHITISGWAGITEVLDISRPTGINWRRTRPAFRALITKTERGRISAPLGDLLAFRRSLDAPAASGVVS